MSKMNLMFRGLWGILDSKPLCLDSKLPLKTQTSLLPMPFIEVQSSKAKFLFPFSLYYLFLFALLNIVDLVHV